MRQNDVACPDVSFRAARFCRLQDQTPLCQNAGPAAEEGLGLQSFRIPNGLQGRLQLPRKYQAFPQIINGGVVSALFDCHGNWTAAIALMDRSGLPRPPLTLTSELLVMLDCLRPRTVRMRARQWPACRLTQPALNGAP